MRSERRQRSSSGESGKSIRPRFPKGLRRAKYRRPVGSARHTNLKQHRCKKRGKYGAIVGRLGSMADQESREAGANWEIEKLTVRAFRGFGFSQCRYIYTDIWIGIRDMLA